MDAADAFTRLAVHPDLDPGLLGRIRAYFAEADDAELFRINLVAWSARHGVALDVAVTHFLHLVHAGLAELWWEAHCPQCNVVLARVPRLAEVRGRHACAYCQREVEARLDDHFEVSFAPSPAVREVHGRVVYRASANVRVLARATVPAGERRRLPVTIPPDVRSVRVVAWSPLLVRVVPAGAAAGPATLRSLGGEDVRFPDALPVGDGALDVAADGPDPVTVMLEDDDMGAYAPDQREPRLTGLDVVSVPAFHALFGGDTLPPERSLAVRDVTIVFTDIRGSTELYQRAGEATAYALVREHFGVLFRAVHAHGGTVVKTIGDAVMAAFRAPAAAVRALLAARAELDRLNAQPGRPAELIVRAAVHRGRVLAVTLNGRLDYFGTTVNEAARMEGTCEEGELVLSDAVVASPGVAEACAGLRIEPFETRFRGLDASYRCHRVFP